MWYIDIYFSAKSAKPLPVSLKDKNSANAIENTIKDKLNFLLNRK